MIEYENRRKAKEAEDKKILEEETAKLRLLEDELFGRKESSYSELGQDSEGAKVED